MWLIGGCAMSVVATPLLSEPPGSLACGTEWLWLVSVLDLRALFVT